MALESAELVQYARDAATRGDDLYALLSVDATTPKEDIHRAWRRAGLKYHPDKAGANYDPAKYESFERARDVLVDPAAREAYDNGLKAVLQKRKRVEEMSSDRRRFVEELERAEREAKRAKTGDGEAGGLSLLSQAERNRAAEAGRRRMEERARLMREAEERSRMRAMSREKSQEPSAPATPTATATPSRQGPNGVPKTKEDGKEPKLATPDIPSANGDEYDAKIAELERKLKEKRERKAAKKAGRKSDVSGLSSRWPPSAEEDPIKPPDGEEGESKADGEKGTDRPTAINPMSSSFAFRPPYAASAPTSPAVGKQTSSGSGSTSSFAATMARLKAAQFKRDEEKRKRDAEATASAPAPAGEQQAV
jgi:DnaJ family protein C protein 17